MALFVELYVIVVFVTSCLYSAVGITLVREQRFIRVLYYHAHTRANGQTQKAIFFFFFFFVIELCTHFVSILVCFYGVNF